MPRALMVAAAWGDNDCGSVRMIGNADLYETPDAARASAKVLPLPRIAVGWPPIDPTFCGAGVASTAAMVS